MTIAMTHFKPTILFVDDEPAVLSSLVRFSRGKPWIAVTASSGDEGLAYLKNKTVDIVVSDMRMPGMSGVKFLTEVRTRFPEKILILLTAFSDMEELKSAVNQAKIYNYINKPWCDSTLSQALDQALLEQAWRQEQALKQDITEKKMRTLGKLALLKDKQAKERGIETSQALVLLKHKQQHTPPSAKELCELILKLVSWQEDTLSNHSQFSAEYSVKIARAMGLSVTEQEDIYIAATLQNIGLLTLPVESRFKPVFEMSRSEVDLYRKHSITAESLLSKMLDLSRPAKIIRSHHEYLDGSGYPDNLDYRSIPLLSKIITVVSDYYDIFHGLLLKKQAGRDDAKATLQKYAGKRYDARVVEKFFDVLDDNCKFLQHNQFKNAFMLKPGMVVAQDVRSIKGVVLVAKGVSLSSVAIAKLQKYEKNFNVTLQVPVNEME